VELRGRPNRLAADVEPMIESADRIHETDRVDINDGSGIG
jgi:hypothetical protein